MGDVVEIRGKTEQRVDTVISTLKRRRAVTYAELEDLTGADYGALLYILTTLVALGYAERVEDDATNRGPGRPVVRYRWVQAQAIGAR